MRDYKESRHAKKTSHESRDTHIYDVDESRESDMHMNPSHYAVDEHMCEHIRVLRVVALTWMRDYQESRHTYEWITRVVTHMWDEWVIN
jgi:hypothetical protein